MLEYIIFATPTIQNFREETDCNSTVFSNQVAVTVKHYELECDSSSCDLFCCIRVDFFRLTVFLNKLKFDDEHFCRIESF